jgi:hypothetical protein
MRLAAIPAAVQGKHNIPADVLSWLRNNVTILSFIAGAVAATFAGLNYFNQPSNRPELISTPNNKVSNDHVVFEWANTGRRVVQRGFARLFVFDPYQNKWSYQIGDTTRINGIGTAAYALTAEFDGISALSLPIQLLVCTIYFDQRSSEYHQAFLYERRGRTVLLKTFLLDQLPSPNYDIVCPN